MQYRKFRTQDRENSLLGFGIMRLLEDERGMIDREKSIKLIRYGIDHGINYIDTGYTYHNGASEKVVSLALKDGYREKVILADKLPIWLAKTEDDLGRIFDRQLSRLDVDYLDMYLVHNIVPPNWRKVQKLNVIPFLETLKKQGRIRHIGFSFHGELDLFREVVDAYDWEFCQIQLNYLDQDIQAGLKGLEYAREREIDVVVMEPLKGGRITDIVPPSVQEIWDRAKDSGAVATDRTPAEWAFRWVSAQPGVSLILSGMNSYKQLDENIRIFSQEDILTMTDTELKVIDEVAAEYNSKIKHQCTSCGYCMPCRKKLEIPKIIDYINNWHAFGRNPNISVEYRNWIGDGYHASDCVGCGECEEKCPQSLPIREIMNEAVGEFGL